MSRATTIVRRRKINVQPLHRGWWEPTLSYLAESVFMAFVSHGNVGTVQLPRAGVLSYFLFCSSLSVLDIYLIRFHVQGRVTAFTAAVESRTTTGDKTRGQRKGQANTRQSRPICIFVSRHQPSQLVTYATRQKLKKSPPVAATALSVSCFPRRTLLQAVVRT